MDDNKSKKPPETFKQIKQRLLKKYFENGIDSLSEQEILELLAAYSQCKTVPDNIFDKHERLTTLAELSSSAVIEAVGNNERLGTLLKLLARLSYYMPFESRINQLLDSTKAARYFFSRSFVPSASEQMVAVALGKNLKVTKISKYVKGTSKMVSVPHRFFVEFALKSNADIIMISHTHPYALGEPSGTDIAFTRAVMDKLSILGIVLADHIIVGKYSIISMREQFSFFPPLPKYKVIEDTDDPNKSKKSKDQDDYQED